MSTDLTGTVRLSPNGRSLAVLWPSPPHANRWIVTDQWGSTGYETDARVADWPVVGAVPYSPAAGMALDGTAPAAPVCDCGAPIPEQQRKAYCSDRCRWADDDHGSDIDPMEEAA
jgi:hypothetical protein